MSDKREIRVRCICGNEARITITLRYPNFCKKCGEPAERVWLDVGPGAFRCERCNKEKPPPDAAYTDG
jgi:hypothetical protein